MDLTKLPDDPLAGLPDDPALAQAPAKGLGALPDDPLGALADDPLQAQTKPSVAPLPRSAMDGRQRSVPQAAPIAPARGGAPNVSSFSPKVDEQPAGTVAAPDPIANARVREMERVKGATRSKTRWPDSCPPSTRARGWISSPSQCWPLRIA